MDRPSSRLRYVALGDSYTIGTAVDPGDRWPDKLVESLAGSSFRALELVANLGVNGYTSRDLILDELPALATLRPEFATVLIGVNDVVQGVPTAAYEANVASILDALLDRLPASRIVTVAIPDYSVTPAGNNYGNPRQQHDGIVANNLVMASSSAARGITYVDTFDLSLRVVDDRGLLADDGLHPSGRQYALWVERIAPIVALLLSDRSA